MNDEPDVRSLPPGTEPYFLPMAQSEESGTNWDAVIGRSLAYLCLRNNGELEGKGLVDKARFLMSLGLGRADAAALLGSSDESLRVTLGRAQRAPSKKTKSRSTKKAD